MFQMKMTLRHVSLTLDMGMNSGSHHTLQVRKYFKKNDKATFSLWP